MGKKDLMFGLMLCVPMLGLGHLYAGDKRRGLTVLAVQVILLIISGIMMIVSKPLLTLCYILILAVGLWAAYDTYATIKIINDNN